MPDTGAPSSARCSAHFRQGDIEAICEERAGHEAEFGRTENEHHGYLTGPGWRISVDWWARVVSAPIAAFMSASPEHEHAFYFVGKEWEPDGGPGANGNWVYLLYCNCGSLRKGHKTLDQIGGPTP